MIVLVAIVDGTLLVHSIWGCDAVDDGAIDYVYQNH
jgi:hypothetical protein